MTGLPHQEGPWSDGHMVVCGDDGLARRLAVELREVYRQHVVLIAPDDHVGEQTTESLADRIGQTSPIGRDIAAGPSLHELTASTPTRGAFQLAEVASADALALLYEDDETNLRAALAARRLNPGLRLVVRMYNR
ncbi:NAD-binding protein, partial [Streptomyces sp. NPDC004779]